jgi:hypothetical protein
MENKELETWLAETKAKNLSKDELNTYVFCLCDDKQNIYNQLQGEFAKDKAQILFNQWQKESEFSPKRGDRVLVWNTDERKVFERIFLANIEGSSYPIIVVCESSKNEFTNNKTFATNYFINMKPLPTETDFKSKVIELVEKRIEICKELIDENKNENKFIAAQMWKNCDNEAREILNQIKQLC